MKKRDYKQWPSILKKIIKVLEMKKYNYQNIKFNGYTGLTGY